MPSASQIRLNSPAGPPATGPTRPRNRFSEALTVPETGNPSEKRLLAVAAMQMGLFRQDQALHAGFTQDQIEARVDLGVWERVHRGVYRIAGLGDWPARTLLAGVLAGGPLAISSHRSSGWLWGLLPAPPQPEISVPAHVVRVIPGVLVHRSSDLDRTETHHRLRIPTTSPLRVMVDAGAVMPIEQVRDMLDTGRALKLFTPMAALAELERVARKGRRGVGALRTILDEAGVTGTHHPSKLEAKMRRLIKRAGLPDPICEMVAGPHGEYRLDFPFPEALLDIEVDGWDVHSSFDASHLDKTRQNKLTAEGYGFLRYDWTHVTREAEATMAEMARVYAQRVALFSEALTVRETGRASENGKGAGG